MAPGALSLGDILGLALVPIAEPCPSFCELTVGKAFCGVVAGHYGVEWADAWDDLCAVPDEALGGLKTASGWTALAATIAKNLRASGEPLIPNVH